VVSRAGAVSAGLALDQLLGDPPTPLHPVAWFGSAMSAVERRLWRDDRRAGALHGVVGLGLGLAAGRAVRSTAVAMTIATAGRTLRRTAVAIGEELQRGDLERARLLLPSLVGRSPEGLDEKEMARAVVESVAENTVDAVVAPALWALAAGAPGVLAHRAVNTMDAMVGYRSPRYARYGTAAARLDDAMAWVPARATAALVAAVRPRAAGEVWRAVRLDAPAHPSPNAGVAEAAFAAALGLRLGGTSCYGDRVEDRPALGTGRPAEPTDIARATRLSAEVTAALGAGLLGIDLLGRFG
jgi:adenosylcobinamide-phosphate synthase